MLVPGVYLPSIDSSFQPDQLDENTIENMWSGFLDTLRQFGEAMDEEGPFFLGKDPTLVDYVLAPWAVRLWIFDHFKEGGLGLPDEGNRATR